MKSFHPFHQNYTLSLLHKKFKRKSQDFHFETILKQTSKFFWIFFWKNDDCFISLVMFVSLPNWDFSNTNLLFIFKIENQIRFNLPLFKAFTLKLRVIILAPVYLQTHYYLWAILQIYFFNFKLKWKNGAKVMSSIWFSLPGH